MQAGNSAHADVLEITAEGMGAPVECERVAVLLTDWHARVRCPAHMRVHSVNSVQLHLAALSGNEATHEYRQTREAVCDALVWQW